MFGSLVALGLLILMTVTKEPQYAIAAGLFDLSGVIYTVLTRPRLFKEKPLKEKPLKMVNGQWVDEVNSNEDSGR